MTKQRTFSAIVMSICLLFAGFAFAACGNQTNEPTITEIYIQDGTYTTEINKGEDYPLANIKVMAKRSDESELNISGREGLTFSNIDTSTAGEKNLVAYYQVDKDTKLSSSIKKVKVYGDVTSIALAGGYETSVPVNSVYSTAGVRVTVTYEGGLTKTITSGETDLGIDAPNTSVVSTATNKSTLRVTYKGQTASADITVLPIVITQINITACPEDMQLTAGLTLEQIKAQIRVEGKIQGFTGTVQFAEGTDYTVSGLDLTVGTKNVVVTAINDTTKTANATIKLYGDVDSIAIKAGTYTSEVLVGSTYSTNGIEVNVTYEGDVTKTIVAGTTGLTFSDVDTSVVGTTTLTATYAGVTSPAVNITIQDIVMTSISIQNKASLPTKVAKGDTTAINFDEIVITGIASSSPIAFIIDSADYSWSGFDVNAVGSQTVVVTYRDTNITDSFTVMVYGDVVSFVISGVSDSVQAGTALNTDNMILTITYEGGLVEDAYARDLLEVEIGEFATDIIGPQTFTVIYQGQQATKTITVEDRTYSVVSILAPASLSLRSTVQKNTYNATGSTGIKGFSDIDGLDTYYVGYDNAYMFQPGLSVYYQGATRPKTITNYSATLKVFAKNVGDADYGDDVKDTYVESFDAITHAIQFKSTAVYTNKLLKLELIPTAKDTISATQEGIIVVPGYNVYNAKDLSVIDNVNALNKWTEFKELYGIPTDINISAVILHNDITITKNDIPSIHFWQESEVRGAPDYDRVLGSLKDNDIGYGSDPYTAKSLDPDNMNQACGAIYRRAVKDNETFTMIGNFFTLSAQEVPLIVRESGDSVSVEGAAIVSHTTLLDVEADNGITDTTNPAYGKSQHAFCNGKFVLNDISLMGNSNKSEDYANSGGVMFLKTRNVITEINNNVSQSWYMSYMFRGASDEVTYNAMATGTADVAEYNAENTAISDMGLTAHITLNKVNAFDSYNTLLYLQGCGKVAINDSILIGAGGPVMIVDQVIANKNDDCYLTGRACYITSDSSILESFVAGTEAWFVSFNATEMAGGIKALDGLFTNFNVPKTITNDNKMNLVCVFKSDATAGLGDYKTSSTFNDTAAAYTTGYATAERYALQAALSGASIDISDAHVLKTFNGATIVPNAAGDGFLYASPLGGDPNDPVAYITPLVEALSTSTGYLAGYLNNNMGIVLGLMNKA